MTARHRVAALVALVAVPLGVLVTVVGFLRGLPGLLVPLGLLVVALASAYLAVVRRGIRRRLHAGVAGMLAVLSVVGAVVVRSELPLLVAGAALVLVGAFAAGYALSWSQRPEGHRVGRARHPVLFVNPASGDGVAESVGLAEEARARGIRVVELGEGDDLGALAARAARRGADCLGMAGGDGSLAVVAEVAMAAHVPFVCVPAGTRNHFALDLGLDRSDPVVALDAFGEALQRRVDVGVVNGRVFLNNVSIGAYGEVVAEDQYRENKVGTALERLPDLVGPDAEPLDLRFVDGEGQERDHALVLHVSNNSYQLSPMPGFGSRPSLSDGVLGVVAVAGSGDQGRRVVSWEAPSFEVDSGGGSVASGIDGESVELETPVRFSIRPDALRVRIPLAAAGVSPAAKRPPVTLETVARLARVAAGRSPESRL